MDYGLQDLIRSFGLPMTRRARERVERGEIDVMPAGPGATRVFGIVRPVVVLPASLARSIFGKLEIVCGELTLGIEFEGR